MSFSTTLGAALRLSGHTIDIIPWTPSTAHEQDQAVADHDKLNLPVLVAKTGDTWATTQPDEEPLSGYDWRLDGTTIAPVDDADAARWELEQKEVSAAVSRAVAQWHENRRPGYEWMPEATRPARNPHIVGP